jgi:hypothetical protein
MPKNRRKRRNEKTGSATKRHKNAQRRRGTADYGHETNSRRKSRFFWLENIRPIRVIRGEFLPHLPRLFLCLLVPFRGYETNAFLPSHIRPIRVIRGHFSPLFRVFFCVF